MRYRAAQWAHGPRWQLHAPGGETWHGFDGVRALDGLPPELLRVPLAGHTRGHHGIALRAADGWLLHAGDAYFHAGEMAPSPRCPATLRVYQRVMEVDREARLGNQARLHALAHDAAAGVRVFCAHDASELARWQATPPPAG
jgi:glyoxylase-like metal-dependent hydrolase (beta-lactamase superfamily II)